VKFDGRPFLRRDLPTSFVGLERMLTKDLQELITQLEGDSFLFAPDQVRRRIDALDELDAHLGGSGPDVASQDERVRVLRAKIEAANSEQYESVRREIRRGGRADALLRLLSDAGDPAAGLSYDYMDELVSGVLQLREPDRGDVHPGHEMVFYQPTPVRHILQMIRVSGLGADDVLVDLGSGLGHVALLATMLTGCVSYGIEVEEAYVACARECAESLGLGRVRFVQEDARIADFSAGTVFHLYTPFTGTMLANVLERLWSESARRPIRICMLGPCTSVVAEAPWLIASSTRPDVGQIALFRSRS
jgi:Histone methylation protein DOT1